jgi:TonB family protein
MRTTTSTKRRFHLISPQVCVAALIVLFMFAPHPHASSMAQSEDPIDKKTASPPALSQTGIIKPRVTYKENAKYTEEARENVIHGTVALNVIFGVDGTISGVRVTSGLPYGLTESAIDAAGRVRFESAIKNGEPATVRGTIEFTFHLFGLDEKSIRKMLRNDFPVLSDKVVETMATILYARGDRDTQKAWRFGQQCLEKGVSKLPQQEQQELMSLTLEAIRGLDDSDQQIYQRLMDKSKTEQLRDYEEMQITEFRSRGVAKLQGEKRRRAEALYNRAATLGTELP